MKKSKKFLIVSNRLPVQVGISDDEIEIKPSVGGLATGMLTVSESMESVWIGWTGVDHNNLSESQQEYITESLSDLNCLNVNLTEEQAALYYEGFSNKTIWPLFHYFTQYVVFEEKHWQAYKEVNQKFADVVLKNLSGVDKIWIHDYHLLLLPQLIKEQNPNVTIGFFLHIPFPSYELFRTLPWRMEIINGMLGADLLGFHTFDYERHFMSSVRRLLGYDININEIILPTRRVKVDNFPMGIDYDKFQEAALISSTQSKDSKSDTRKQLEMHHENKPDTRFILSIDRLDYTKGIINRLEAYEYFLKQYPEYIDKVTLVLLAVPSRIGVEQYQKMKSDVDETVGRINGEYSTFNHSPIWYFYRSMPFEDLVDMYNYCEIALITPIRDGMNLVAKEFMASKTNGLGVLILSEMAGASKEMAEAVIINPNDKAEIAAAIKKALEMTPEEQIERNSILQKRLRRYNVHKWAADFLNSMEKVRLNVEQSQAKKLTPELKTTLINDLLSTKERVLFLDYDGTLTGFRDTPNQAKPDTELYYLLESLSAKKGNTVVIISGRDKDILDEWFGKMNLTLIAEHGVWVKSADSEWQMTEPLDSTWKSTIRSALDFYVDRTPGSFIEEKNFSLVWHYRKTDPELWAMRDSNLRLLPCQGSTLNH
jgi:trehalose 6-phosphate synthase/phosphatase